MAHSKTKKNYKEPTFEDQLGSIAQDISRLSDKFLKLKNLKNEMQSITSKKGLFNLKILFMAFGNLEIRMQKFKSAMLENTEDITEDITEDTETPLISTYIKKTLDK